MSERTRNRLAKLEAAFGLTSEPPVPTLSDAYNHFGIIIEHRRAVNAGECAYGHGLEPFTLQLMHSHDRLYGRSGPNGHLPAKPGK